MFGRLGGGIRVSTENVSNAAAAETAIATPDSFPCRLVMLAARSHEGYRDAGVDQELQTITAVRMSAEPTGAEY